MLSVRSALLCAVLLTMGGQAGARTLHVGPQQAMKMPSEAAAVALSGDTVIIDAGEYLDCAIWKASNLTVQGAGPSTVITDKTCAGKGIFVTDGNDITVRDLTLTRARVPDGTVPACGPRAST